MAHTNWFKGIDEGSSTPGGEQIALASHVFVDQSFVGTSDGSPDQPYKDYTGLIAGETSLNNKTVIIADGTYTDDFINIAFAINVKLIANTPGNVVFETTTSTDQLLTPSASGTTGNEINGIHVKNYQGSSNDAWSVEQLSIKNCIIQDCQSRAAGIDAENTNWINSIQELQTTLSDTLAQYDRCNFFNACDFRQDNAVPAATGDSWLFNNCHFSDNATMNIDDTGGGQTLNFNNCNNRPTINAISGSAKTPDGEVNPSSFNDAAILSNGTTLDFEFLLQNASPLIGAGSNNSTIGAFKKGDLISLTTPDLDYNIDTSGSTIVKDSGRKYGNIRHAFVTLSQVRKSPVWTLNGIEGVSTDIARRVYEFPVRKVLKVTYRETVSGSDITKLFAYGLPSFLDDSGRSTGDLEFDPFDISSTGDIVDNPDLIAQANLIDVAQYQADIELIDRAQALPFDGVNQSAENTGLDLNLGDSQTSSNDFIQLVLFTKDVNTANLLPASSGDATVRSDILASTATDIERPRPLWAVNGRNGSKTMDAAFSITNPLFYRTMFGFLKNSHDANNWIIYSDRANTDQGSVNPNTLLSTDQLRLKDKWFGRSSVLGFQNITVQSEIVLQPVMTDDQFDFLYRGKEGLTWDLLTSQNARDVGIGVDGTDTIGVGGITTLIKYFVDVSDIFFSSPNYYLRERVSADDTFAQLANFVGDPNNALVDF